MSRRDKLLQELSEFKFVPGHNPDLSKLSEDQLEKRLTLLRNTFKLAFEEENNA